MSECGWGEGGGGVKRKRCVRCKMRSDGIYTFLNVLRSVRFFSLFLLSQLKRIIQFSSLHTIVWSNRVRAETRASTQWICVFSQMYQIDIVLVYNSIKPKQIDAKLSFNISVSVGCLGFFLSILCLTAILHLSFKFSPFLCESTNAFVCFRCFPMSFVVFVIVI